MRRLKILLIILGSFILLIGLTIGGLLIAFSSKVDDFDETKVNTEFTTTDLLASKLNASLDAMGESYTLDVLLDETDLNTLLYAFVKENVNDKYDPINPENDEDKYLVKIDAGPNMPILVKHVYANINDDEISISMPGELFGFFKTGIYLTFKVYDDETNYNFEAVKLKLGRLNLLSGLTKGILKSSDAFSSLNNLFEENELPFKVKESDMVVYADKNEFSDWVNKLLTENKDSEESGDDVMTKTLINLLLSKDYNLLSLGVLEDGKFGFSIDLSKLKVSEEDVTLDSDISSDFDRDTFIKSKTQGLVIDLLNADNEKAITFTEDDISKLIYATTEGYKDFSIDEEIIEGVNFHFDVQGLIFDILTDGLEVNIKVILNINGLKTIGTYHGVTNQVNNEIVEIKMDDIIKLGYEMEITSEFLKGMLKGAFSSQDFITFNDETNTFTITLNVFNKFLMESGSATTLQVSKLYFITDALKVAVETNNPFTDMLLDETRDLIRGVLSDNFINLDEFNLDPDTEENLTNALGRIQESLNDSNEINAEDLESLQETINSMSEVDQREFYEQLQEQAGSTELEQLYHDLFGW